MTDIVERMRAHDCDANPLGCGYAEILLDEAADEIERLREALKAFSCDCEENQCAEWGEDGPRFDCVFRRYRSLAVRPEEQ